jgi:hypothetical protein
VLFAAAGFSMNISRTSRGSHADSPRALKYLRSAFAALSVAVAGAPIIPASAQGQVIPVIGVTFEPGTVSENAGARAAIGTARRYFSSSSSPLTIRLSNDRPDSVSIPAQVTIPSGVDSITFPVAAVDNNVLDGTRNALVSVSAPGFYDTYAALAITDDEGAFSLEIVPPRVGEGQGNARGTLRRSAATTDVAETVRLAVAQTSTVRVPATVTIPAGATSVSFTIEVIDNNIFDGERTERVVATRERDNSSISATFVVLDNENDLTVTVPANVAENAATGTVFATVSRSQAAVARDTNPVAVRLESSDPSELLTARGAVLRPGQREVRVPLQAIDDLRVDGTQRVALEATAQGYNVGRVELNVTDNDRPELQLRLNASTVSESASLVAATGTLWRNTPVETAVSVALRSSSPRVRVPATIVIPRGAVEVRFAIQAVDNSARDGNVSSVITASAPGFPTRTASVQVLDDDGPSLRLSLTPSELEEGLVLPDEPAARGVVSRANTPLNQPVTVLLTSSDDSSLLLATPPPSVQGEPGTRSRSISVTIPAGAQSAAFWVFTPENAVPTDLLTSLLTASALGLNGAALAVDVRDNDDPAQLDVRVAVNLAPLRNPGYRTPIVNEDAGPQAVTATITRNTATTSEVIVQITTEGDLVAPRTVVLPFGQRSVSFFVSPLDDPLFCDQDRPVPSAVQATVAGFGTTVGVFAEGSPFAGAKRNVVTVVDNDPTDGCFIRRRVKVTITPRVARVLAAIAEVDGPNAAIIEVKRADIEFNLALVVDLVSSDPARAAAVPGLARNVLPNGAPRVPTSPARIVLPPRSSFRFDPEDEFSYQLPFAEVPLNAINDRLQQRCANIIITPVVVGYQRLNAAGTAPVGDIIPVSQVRDGNPYETVSDNAAILDAELEVAALSVSPRVINESGASGVATGLVRRAPGVAGSLTVKITTLNSRKVGVSPTNRRDPMNTLDVVIPDGQDEASFNVIAIDNTVADGDVTALLRASTACSTATLSTPILVRDNEAPQLTLRLGPGSMTEGMASTGITAVVARSGSLAQPLTVTLRSSDPSEFAVPATVTIPAGHASAAFVPRVVDDAIVDGAQRATVTASAPFLRPSHVTISILDNDAR